MSQTQDLKHLVRSL